MEVIKTPEGRIKVQDTLGTLEVAEKWEISPETYTTSYLRNICSLYGSAVNKSFTVSQAHPLIENDTIKIIRTR